jgi:hypothetical protein
MRVPPEIIILFFLISFLVYTMPMVLVKFSKTTKGKFLLLMLTIVVTLYNRVGGLLMAMLIIFLSEFNYEVNNGILYEGYKGSNDDSDDDDEDDDKKKSSTKDILSIAELLKAKSASSIIPSSKTT